MGNDPGIKYQPFKPCKGNSPVDNVIKNNNPNDISQSEQNDEIERSFNNIQNYDSIIDKSKDNIPNISNKKTFKCINNNLNTYQTKVNNYIDKSLIKFDDINRNPFYVNLLHYDENLINYENQNYYKYFKLNIVGGYFGNNNLNMFKYYIDAINRSKIFIRYILIVSGSNSVNVLNSCYNYKFIDDILIFCNNINNYNYLRKYNKIKLVTNSFETIMRYLKSKSYTSKELDMSNQIPTTPLITFFEYKNCYFAIHRMLSKFFKEN